MEGCEICKLSPSIDGHLYYISFFLTDESYYKNKVILDVNFTFLPLGLTWKVVKDVHCPLLLMDTGLMSLSVWGRKLLQKEC